MPRAAGLRRNANIAAVALANKNARVIWTLLRRDEDYRVRAYSAGWVQAQTQGDV